MIKPGRQNPRITIWVRIMYIMLNCIIEYAPPLAWPSFLTSPSSLIKLLTFFMFKPIISPFSFSTSV